MNWKEKLCQKYPTLNYQRMAGCYQPIATGTLNMIGKFQGIGNTQRFNG